MVEQHSIPLYLSQPHPCGYLPNREAQTAFLPEHIQLTPSEYEQLLNMGFRRSGSLVYKPHCENCQACIACRIPVDAFKPSRSQRRVWNKNKDLRIQTTPARFNANHYQLYLRYQEIRHPGGEMASFNEQDYQHFICDTLANACFIEFYGNTELLAVAVTDQLTHSLSAVYTFFDPKASARSLGTFAILQQIEHARRAGKSYLYLGYAIADCQKMRYKADFQPQQQFVEGQWQLNTPLTDNNHT